MLLHAVASCALAAAALAAGAPAVPTVELANVGHGQPPVQMPLIGLGTAGLGGWGNSNASVVAIKLWLQNGGRAIHGAWMYCNQQSIGQAIIESGVDRKELFVMSMLPQWHLGYNETLANFADTLQQLQLQYVDLYMFHWPGMYEDQLPMMAGKHPEVCGTSVLEVPPCKRGQPSWKQCRLGSWKAMLELQAAGKIRALGTSNFEVHQLQQLVETGSPPAVNQVSFHIGYHDDYLNDWCKKHKVVLQAYSPLGGGAIPKGQIPAVNAVATKHNVSSAQVALKWIVQQGVGAIPKADTTAYQLENMELWGGLSLSPAEMRSLSVLANPPGNGKNQDPASLMCIDHDQGRMARCLYLE
eukprot:SAG22_NODE_1141_length_5388_cov_2.279259_1_plen_356_part_00